MKPLKIGIIGVRGIVGESFTPELVVEFAQAFGTYMDGGRILVCRDTRPSGPMVQAGVRAGLLAAGCEVTDLGICTTPSMQLAITMLGAVGGIAITAGLATRSRLKHRTHHKTFSRSRNGSAADRGISFRIDSSGCYTITCQSVSSPHSEIMAVLSRQIGAR